MNIDEIPQQLALLEKLEQILIAQRIVFQKIIVMRRLPKCRTCWGQNTSGYLFIKEWNNLPNDIISAYKYNAFKNRFLRILN